MEDWEEAAETSRGPAQTQTSEQPSTSGLNASAPSFSFNPGASTFKPTFAAAPAAPPPQPQSQQPQPQAEPESTAPPVPDDETMAEAAPPLETKGADVPPRLPEGDLGPDSAVQQAMLVARASWVEGGVICRRSAGQRHGREAEYRGATEASTTKV